jgi:hypothetical protein
VVVLRNQPVSGPAGPIVVCTRNDDLQAIVDATPADRREDLVFIQNGMLQPWLDAQDLGENTQVRCGASGRPAWLAGGAPSVAWLGPRPGTGMRLPDRSIRCWRCRRCWCTLPWPRRARRPSTARPTSTQRA